MTCCQNAMQEQEVSGLIPSGRSEQYYPDSPPLKGGLRKALPPGVQSLFVQRIPESGKDSHLLMWSRSAARPFKERPEMGVSHSGEVGSFPEVGWVSGSTRTCKVAMIQRRKGDALELCAVENCPSVVETRNCCF